MRTLLLLAVVLVTGCGSSSNEYAVLYETPQGATTSSLFGMWDGQVSGADLRWVISQDQLTVANKCGDTIVGIDVAAAASETENRILEAADAGDNSCFVRVGLGSLKVCPSDPFEPKESCFEHEAKSLTLFDSNIALVTLTKLTDGTP